MKSAGSHEAFIIQILDTQNATWQGTVTWTSKKQTVPFRSALELLRLLDSTLTQEEEDPPEGAEDHRKGDVPFPRACEAGTPADQ